jgi:protein arginine N-methyltransferase 1
MYSINGYGDMIADDIRTDAYVRALRQAVRPGSVVLDIGSGTGFFALLAHKFGARRVFGVESSDVIDVARKMAVANDCVGSVEFIQGMSTDISLPERADVVISDLRGALPFFQRHLLAIADARKRFLAPGGALIPCRDTLWIACVEAPELHRVITMPWSDNKYGLDMRDAGVFQANRWRRASVNPEQLISRPECCATIDYSSVVNPDLDTTATVSASRAGKSHGLCVWFDAELADGISFSNSPENPGLIYGQAFFPWPEPVELATGDSVSVRLRSDLIGEDYLWTWESWVQRRRDPGKSPAHFRQSEFFSEAVSADRLRKQAANYAPVLSEDGQIDCLILALMRDHTSLGDIALRIASLYPARFQNRQEALTRVAKLSVSYSC